MRDDHLGRTALPRPHQDLCSASGTRPAAYANHGLARRELRRRRVGYTPSGTRGVLNDALSIYFAEPTLASAFVARWCIGAKVETAGGVFQLRDNATGARVGAGLHKTP